LAKNLFCNTVEYFDFFESPIGLLQIKACDAGVVSVLFCDTIEKIECFPNEHIVICKHQLSEYFSATRTVFSVPLCFNGTEFQKKVWGNCNSIAYGKTKTYGEIALEIDTKKSALAVGQALTRNPILIIVPCHRVLHASTKKSGYEMRSTLLSSNHFIFNFFNFKYSIPDKIEVSGYIICKNFKPYGS